MDDLEVFIQLKQWNCTVIQIQEKVLATKSTKNSNKICEALKEASLKKSISVAKVKHKICAIVDEVYVENSLNTCYRTTFDFDPKPDFIGSRSQVLFRC